MGRGDEERKVGWGRKCEDGRGELVRGGGGGGWESKMMEDGEGRDIDGEVDEEGRISHSRWEGRERRGRESEGWR